MSKKQISSELKLQIMVEVLKGERLITGIAVEPCIHRSVVHSLRDELLAGTGKAFSIKVKETGSKGEKAGRGHRTPICASWTPQPNGVD